MGALSASDFYEQVKDGNATLDQALIWHLQGNHYPPVPLSMLEPCKAAIKAANEDDWDREINLPDGVTWEGKTSAPASAIVEGHHLDAFIGDGIQWEGPL